MSATDYTDSTLKARWERHELALRTGSTPELEFEGREILREWNDILARKRRGEVTEPDRVIAVRRIIGDVAKLHGLPLAIDDEEFERDAATSMAQYRQVTATFEGGSSLVRAEWRRVMDLINQELSLLGFVKDVASSVHREPISQSWLVDLHVWDGPDLMEALGGYEPKSVRPISLDIHRDEHHQDDRSGNGKDPGGS